MILDLTQAEIERFHSRIVRGPDCWEWAGQTNNQGYGRFEYYRAGSRRRVLSHRLSYWLATGESLSGRVIRHACDNPRCVRIDHLTPGTQVDNMRDAKERGRVNVTGLLDRHSQIKAQMLANLATGEKECSSCGEVKPLDEFRTETRRVDGRAGSCASCHRLAEKERRRRMKPDSLRKHKRDYCAGAEAVA